MLHYLVSYSFILHSEVSGKHAKKAGIEEHLSVFEIANAFLEWGRRKVLSARKF